MSKEDFLLALFIRLLFVGLGQTENFSFVPAGFNDKQQETKSQLDSCLHTNYFCSNVQLPIILFENVFLVHYRRT
jgi:hypothetical protein